MSKPPRARLFFALWPDERVRGELGELALRVRAECGGRAIARENIHLTLFFVGSVERARLDALRSAAARVRGERFELAVDRVGYWRHNRIAWAGTSRAPEPLLALEAGLRTELAHENVHGEMRAYAPHITLVRNAERRPLARAVPPCAWPVHELTLVESVAAGGGVRYDPLEAWALG